MIFPDEILSSISHELENARESVQVITAYCKKNAFEVLDKKISDEVLKKRLLVRFRLDDLIKGSTDFSVLDYCKENNWDVYIKFDLHAKTYIIDNLRGIVGSANTTNSGLGFNPNSNYEIAALVNLEEKDLNKIEHLFSAAIQVNDSLYSELKRQYEKCSKQSTAKANSWDKNILSLLRPDVETVFSYEFPDTDSIPSNDYIQFLDLSTEVGIETLKEGFSWSNAYLWLITTLKKNNGQMYFGALTAALHDSIVSDPKPFRKDVKILLSNLLSWVQLLGMEEIVIDRPNYSQRITLIGVK